MFDDPQVVIGAVIGLLIVIAGTTVAVLGHLRRERDNRRGRRLGFRTPSLRTTKARVLAGLRAVGGRAAGCALEGHTVMSAAHSPCRLQCSIARRTVPGSTFTTTETTGAVAIGERSKRAIGASPASSSIQVM